MLKYILLFIRRIKFIYHSGNTDGIYNQSSITDDYIRAKAKGLK